MLSTSKSKKLRSPIVWFGGKGQMVSKLLKYVPQHKYYLEAFGGGGSLLFAKEPSSFEVYNDLDELLVNFFRVLRDEEKFERFYKLAVLTPYSRREFYRFRELIHQTEDEVEKAYMFYYITSASFSGNFTSGFSYSLKAISRNMTKSTSRYLSNIERLPDIHERVMRVIIENLDGLECIEKYGSAWNYEESFIYLDPPYVPETRRSGKYRYEVDRDYHANIVEYLIKNQNRNKFMISGYDNEIYIKLEENGWKKICWEVACHAAGKTRQTGIRGECATFIKNQRRVDCIWINY